MIILVKILLMIVTAAGWNCEPDFCTHQLPSLPGVYCEQVVNIDHDNFVQCANLPQL